jgi:cell division protein FtsQ
MKKKKKKRKLKKVFVFIFFLLILGVSIFLLSLVKVKGYYVLGNGYVDEDTVLETCGLDEETSYFLTWSFLINKKCKNNSMIKSVKVDHTKTFEIRLLVEEYKVLFKYNNYAINELGKKVDSPNEDAPILINKVSDKEIYERFIKKMNKVDSEILSIVSDIKYDPNDVDNERFLFFMNDGNMVYVTLSKITKINSYPSITKTIENKKGVLYLDYGNYFVPME